MALLKCGERGMLVSESGVWLSITDYAEYRGVSTSTVRRYIKAGQVKLKQEKGKYFIFVSGDNYRKREQKENREIFELRLVIKELGAKIRMLEEDNNDLKMLVSLYEGKNLKKPPSPSLNQ